MAPSSSSSEAATFYQDLSTRLTEELARAQGRPASVGPAAPWLDDADHLPPLLASYDERILELERSEGAERARADDLEADLRAEAATNGKLRAELKASLEAAVKQNLALGSNNGRTPNARAASDAILIKELKDRLDVMHNENQELTEAQHEAGDELDRLRNEKMAQASDHMGLIRQLSAIRDEYEALDRQARAAAQSRDRARSELKACAGELMTSQEYVQQAMAIAERHATERDGEAKAVEEHRQLLDELNTRMLQDRERLTADLAVARAEARDMRVRADELSNGLKGSTEREQALMERLQDELQDKGAGVEAIHVLEGRLAEGEGRIQGAMDELSQARAALGQLTAERNEFAGRADKSERELAATSQKLGHYDEDEKTRRETLTGSMRREAMSRNQGLEEEVRVLETTVADLQHQLARANRRAGQHGRFEQQTYSFLATGGALAPPEGGDADLLRGGGGGVTMVALEEISSKLAAVERERDSLDAASRSTALQLRTGKEAAAQEQAATSARAEQVQRQLHRAEDELGSLRQERARLLGLNAELDVALDGLRSELATLRHNSAEESRISEVTTSGEIASLKRQLADARALHDQSSTELEQMLRAQESLGTQYRDEAKGIAERSEALVRELRAESERLALRNTELSTQLAATTSKADHLDGAERGHAAVVISQQRQLAEAQHVNAQQAGALVTLRAAEKSWEAERRLLSRQAREDISAYGGALTAGAAAAKLKASSAGRVRVAKVSSHSSSSSSARQPRVASGLDVKQAAALEVEEALAQARLSQLVATDEK